MPTIETSSPFAELILQPMGDSVGALFEHYQHLLTPREEAVLGARCIGLTYAEAAALFKAPQVTIKQVERQALRHIIFLYRQGR